MIKQITPYVIARIPITIGGRSNLVGIATAFGLAMTGMGGFLVSKIPASAAGIFGTVGNPTAYKSDAGSGLFIFMSNIFKIVGTIGAIYVVFQFIIAGYEYISANGDSKKTELAWAKIWQSILGLVIISSAFILSGVIERLTGISATKPVIWGPN
ncbi:MAG: hypothetical protein WCV93_01045 [Candidatus Shapirobacteria bacterium]|jgi:hypothetical protein